MTKLILSTGNIVSGGSSLIRKPGAHRSNLELTNSLRCNFRAAQEATNDEDDTQAMLNSSLSRSGSGVALNGHAVAARAALANGTANGHANGYANGRSDPYKTANDTMSRKRPPLAAWTQRDGSTLYIPRIDWSQDDAVAQVLVPTLAAEHEAASGSSSGVSTPTRSSSGGLEEEEAQYDTTVKLFFLPGAASSANAADAAAVAAERAQFADEALALVYRELGVERIGLLVLSFPGMSFEGDCEWKADKINATQGNDDEEVATWVATAEALHAQGKVDRLGVAEYGGEKLARFLGRVHVAPQVDQINIRNCCSVPPPLTALAKERGIELLVHGDCTDVLPPGTLRELLGQTEQGAGVLVDDNAVAAGHAAPVDALRGDLTPQWVVKYTAVIRDRGVIENKGYFAGALLHDA